MRLVSELFDPPTYVHCDLDLELGPVKPVNHTSWVAVVTPTDRPKSVCNRC